VPEVFQQSGGAKFPAFFCHNFKKELTQRGAGILAGSLVGDTPTPRWLRLFFP
jgi:hypothetical protein